MNKKNNNWYDAQWNVITGASSLFPFKNGRELCNRFSGDVRYNMGQKQCYTIDDMSHNCYVLKAPFPSSVENHYISTPFGEKLTFHEYRLSTITDKYKTGRNLLVNGLGETFDDKIPIHWIEKMFNAILENPQHNYIIITTDIIKAKNYAKFYIKEKSDNLWLGFRHNAVSLKDQTQSKQTLEIFEKGINNCKLFLYLNDVKAQEIEWLTMLSERYGISAVKWILVESVNFKYDKNNIEKLKQIAAENKIPIWFSEKEIGVQQKPKEFDLSSARNISPKRKALYWAKCASCEEEHSKKLMYKISWTKGRQTSSKTLGFICEECFERFEKSFR